MLWQDLLVARRVEFATIVKAVAIAFDVPTDGVAVVNELEETLDQVTPLTRLLVQRTMTRGDFPMLLSIHVLDRLIEQRLADRAVGFVHLQRLSRALGADLLFSDETTPGDEEELLVRSQGTVERVLLNAGDLERDEYRIAQREAHAGSHGETRVSIPA